ncbi:hypothetical protein ABPG72_005273 [Tetrahymena utriculariae]
MRKNSQTDQEGNGSQSPTQSSKVNTQHQRRQLLRGPPELEYTQPATKPSSETHQQKSNHNGENPKHHGNKSQHKHNNNKKKQPTSNKECRFWNQQRCNKKDCKYQHFSLKHLCTQTNPQLLNRENQTMEDEKLLLIQITEICFVTKEQLNEIIGKPLLSESQKRTIAIGITNKRRANQLKSSIKKEIQNLDDAQLQQFVTVDKFLNQIATVKNNLKNQTPKLINNNQISKNIKQQAKQINQLSNQRTQGQNKQLKTTKKIMDIEETTQQRLTLPLEGIYIDKTTPNIYNSNSSTEVNPPNSIRQTSPQLVDSLITEQEDEQVTLTLPNFLPEDNLFTEQKINLRDEHIIYAEEMALNTTYLNKLIQRVSIQKTQIPNITVYISQTIAQNIYFKNLKDLIINSQMAPRISNNLMDMAQTLWVKLMKLLNTKENTGDIRQFQNYFDYLLIPYEFSQKTKRNSYVSGHESTDSNLYIYNSQSNGNQKQLNTTVNVINKEQHLSTS